MNDYDYNNLKSILAKNPQELYIWWNSLDEDNKSYAMELITVYHKSLKEYQFEVSDDINDLSLAQEVLKKYTLNG
jgi:hypothetical protein